MAIIEAGEARAYVERIRNGIRDLNANWAKADQLLQWAAWYNEYLKWLLAHKPADKHAEFWASEQSRADLDTWISQFEVWQDLIRYYYKKGSPATIAPVKSTTPAVMRFNIATALHANLKATDPSFRALNKERSAYTEWHIAAIDRFKRIYPHDWIYTRQDQIDDAVELENEFLKWIARYKAITGREPEPKYSVRNRPTGLGLPEINIGTFGGGSALLLGGVVVGVVVAAAVALTARR